MYQRSELHRQSSLARPVQLAREMHGVEFFTQLLLARGVNTFVSGWTGAIWALPEIEPLRKWSVNQDTFALTIVLVESLRRGLIRL
jgi:hypothetical protein